MKQSPIRGDDYPETAGRRRAATPATYGNQPGDPVRAAAAITAALEADEPPLRLLLGKAALQVALGKLDSLRYHVERAVGHFGGCLDGGRWIRIFLSLEAARPFGAGRELAKRISSRLPVTSRAHSRADLHGPTAGCGGSPARAPCPVAEGLFLMWSPPVPYPSAMVGLGGLRCLRCAA